MSQPEQTFVQMMLGWPRPASKPERRARWRRTVVWSSAVLLTFAVSVVLAQYNYLVFHLLAEVFTSLLAFGVFVLGLNASRVHGDGFVTVLGWLFVSVAALDIVHAMAYRGMNLFAGYDADLSIQLWIATRFLQAVGLLIAPVCLFNRPERWAPLPFAVYVVVTLLTCLLRWFPRCYIEGQGLTPFKVVSEYVISLILLAALVHIWRRRKQFDPLLLRTLSWAILLSVLSELSFTLYVGVYDFPNWVGHLLKAFAFVLFYRAVVEIGFRRPYDLLFRQLAASENAVRQARDDLEVRVVERTHQLEQAMQELSASEADLRRAQELARVGSWEADLDEGRVTGSEELARILDLPDGPWSVDMLGRLVHEDDRAGLERLWSSLGELDAPAQHDFSVVLSDGARRELSLVARPRDPQEGQARRLSGTVQDITERKEAERELARYRHHLEELVQERTAALEQTAERLRTAQRLESLGQMAGGLAHWYNNLLTIIRGYAEMIAAELPSASPIQADAQQIVATADRAAALTSQMQSYGRRQLLLTRIVQPAEIIGAMTPELREVLGEGIRLEIILNDGGAFAHVDPNHLREMLQSMIRNAREAVMDNEGVTGRVTLSTARRAIPDESDLNLQPGDYLCISVADNGIGLAPADMARLFEPFFTTKARSQHVGMSLSAAYGIAKQLGGDIIVESALGQGTTFTIYLPEAVPASTPSEAVE